MLAVVLTAIISAAPLDDAREAFAAGMARRAAGDPGETEFRAAVAKLEEARRDGESPGLYLALGHARLALGETAAAIRDYRAGLTRYPRHAALAEALSAARAQVGPAAGEKERTILDDPRIVFFAAALASCAFWPLALFAAVRRRPRARLAAALAFVAVLVPAILAMLLPGDPPPFAVIARDGVSLRRGDGFTFPPTGSPLTAGVEADVLFRRGDWLQVRTSTGLVGWLPNADALTFGEESR